MPPGKSSQAVLLISRGIKSKSRVKPKGKRTIITKEYMAFYGKNTCHYYHIGDESNLRLHRQYGVLADEQKKEIFFSSRKSVILMPIWMM